MPLARFQCPACGGALNDPGAGTTLQCPFCSTSVVLPAELIAARASLQGPAARQAAPAAPAPISGGSGERVFAYWEDDEYYYPAVITQSSGANLQVRFDDGNTADLTSDETMDWQVEVDDAVECQAAADGQYYDAVVKAVSGERVQVEYEDGSQEWSDLAHLRLSPAWEEGDRAFVRWEADDYYYAGTITQIGDNEDVSVRFDDGNSAVVSWDDIEPLELEAGDQVESQSGDDNQFYDAQVVDGDGERVQVQYEDGTLEWTTLSAIRVMFE